MALSAAAKKRVKSKLGLAKKMGGRVRGRGDYTFDTARGGFKKAGKGEMNAGGVLGDWIGGAVPLIGSRFRKPVSWLGSTLHRGFKAITGVGDYRVRSNSILTGAKPPSFSTSGRGTIICNREYLGDVLSTTSFAVQSFPLNAGLVATFPWLGTIAGNWEQYCIRGMVFEYRTISATSLTSGSSTGMGAVIMATAYDSVNPNFSTKAQMENHEYSTSAVPSKTFMHPIECARGETPVNCLYVRTGSPVSGTDLRLYDLGNFQIATQGMPHAGDAIGELWVTYDIELLKPQLQLSSPPPAPTLLADHFYALSGVALTAMFGVSPSTTPQSNLGSIATGNTVVFPNLAYDAQYLITWVGLIDAPYSFLSGTSGQTASGGATTGTCTIAMGGGPVASYQGSDTASYTIQFVSTVNVPASTTGAQCIFTSGTASVGGSLSSMDLYVTLMPSTLTVSEEKKKSRVVRRVPEAAARAMLESPVPEVKETKEEKKRGDSDDEGDEEFEEFMRFKRLKAERLKAQKERTPEPFVKVPSVISSAALVATPAPGKAASLK